MQPSAAAPLVAIACGGTGGHLFPGMAVAEALRERGCDILLLVSPKNVDQHAVRSLVGMAVETLPAVGLERGRQLAFWRGLWQSCRASRSLFRRHRPGAVLAMGGFTSAAPVLAGKWSGAATFLHEANSIPGRANRWLAHLVDQAFVYFAEAAGRLWQQRIEVTGLPVRAQFQKLDQAACRTALGLHPRKPVLLILGGSQGATALNDLGLRLLPSMSLLEPELQYIHLTGTNDLEQVRRGYTAQRRKAIVRPFLTEMELALGAATVALSRAGASSLAELAAMEVPAILVPYPTAADNHQFHNARAFVETGAAKLVEQARATPEMLLWEIRGLIRNPTARQALQTGLTRWHFPEVAARIARTVVDALPSTGVPAHGPSPKARYSKPSVAVPALKAETKTG